MGALARIVTSLVAKATGEGQYRPGPYDLPITGGMLPDGVGQFINWWQLGYNPTSFGNRSAMVEACVSAYSQTVAMLPGDHWYSNKKHGRDRVTTSALSRILRKPNDYQSISDFMLNSTRQLYLDGNAYALCLRNDRYEIDEMHLMDAKNSKPQYVGGEIFYQLGGNKIIEQRLGRLPLIPMRDVLHIRLNVNNTRDPLLGESPLISAATDIAAGDAIKQQQLRFFMNQVKPSIILSTEVELTKEQTAQARERFIAQTTGANAGGVPILGYGLKPYPVSMTSKDAQLAEIMKATDQDIALAFRIPLQILGIGSQGVTSTEALMNLWLETGLGFTLAHIEEAFGRTFGLFGQPDDYMELDTAALMRSNYKDRIDGLARGVQGGIFSPNEARNKEGYNDVKYGDEPRVQQQVVPLSAAAAIPSGPPGQSTKIPASPTSPSAPSQPTAPDGSKPNDDNKRFRQSIAQRANRVAIAKRNDARPDP
jgi:HK97 family phage portal protein